jgi:small subunit ribosomal protein S1
MAFTLLSPLAEDVKDDPKPAAKKKAAKKEAAPAINNVAASTTLGDLDVLAKLKADMEGEK